MTFLATSHANGACDGIEGTVLGLAAKTNLQRIAEPIATTEDFFSIGQFLILQTLISNTL